MLLFAGRASRARFDQKGDQRGSPFGTAFGIPFGSVLGTLLAPLLDPLLALFSAPFQARPGAAGWAKTLPCKRFRAICRPGRAPFRDPSWPRFGNPFGPPFCHPFGPVLATVFGIPFGSLLVHFWLPFWHRFGVRLRHGRARVWLLRGGEPAPRRCCGVNPPPVEFFYTEFFYLINSVPPRKAIQ